MRFDAVLEAIKCFVIVLYQDNKVLEIISLTSVRNNIMIPIRHDYRKKKCTMPEEKKRRSDPASNAFWGHNPQIRRLSWGSPRTPGKKKG